MFCLRVRLVPMETGCTVPVQLQRPTEPTNNKRSGNAAWRLQSLLSHARPKATHSRRCDPCESKTGPCGIGAAMAVGEPRHRRPWCHRCRAPRGSKLCLAPETRRCFAKPSAVQAVGKPLSKSWRMSRSFARPASIASAPPSQLCIEAGGGRRQSRRSPKCGLTPCPGTRSPLALASAPARQKTGSWRCVSFRNWSRAGSRQMLSASVLPSVHVKVQAIGRWCWGCCPRCPSIKYRRMW